MPTIDTAITAYFIASDALFSAVTVPTKFLINRLQIAEESFKNHLFTAFHAKPCQAQEPSLFNLLILFFLFTVPSLYSLPPSKRMIWIRHVSKSSHVLSRAFVPLTLEQGAPFFVIILFAYAQHGCMILRPGEFSGQRKRVICS